MTTAVETPEPAKKRIHGAWYSLVAVPGLLAIFVLATHIPKLIHGFSSLRMPTFTSSPVDVDLKVGENKIYVEGDDTRALATMSCALRDATGTRLELRKVGGHETYTYGSFVGVAAFEVDVATPGAHSLDCTTDPPVRFAIGLGFPFMSIVWCLLALFLALPLTGVTGYVVNRIRNGKRKGARVT